jgi:hypothetical protein
MTGPAVLRFEHLVDALGQLEFDRQPVQGRHGAGHLRLQAQQTWGAHHQFEQILHFAEMGQHPDAGFALAAIGFDDAVIAAAVRRVGLERRHIWYLHHRSDKIKRPVSLDSIENISRFSFRQFRIYLPMPANFFACNH